MAVYSCDRNMAVLHHWLAGGRRQHGGGGFCTALDPKFCFSYLYFSYSAFSISLTFDLLIDVSIVISQ